VVIRREQLLTEAGSQVQQMRHLLECAWPAVLDAARQPFRSVTWTAALAVVTGRGRQKPCLRIVRNVFAALTDRTGVSAQRPGALERIALLLENWQRPRSRRQPDGRMADHRVTSSSPGLPALHGGLPVSGHGYQGHVSRCQMASALSVWARKTAIQDQRC